ncbi:MAG: hypothetical protein P4K83_09140 [Terracidiphilus sp.]|nr:hypothetical protein [Terracidiphilus sp.]
MKNLFRASCAGAVLFACLLAPRCSLAENADPASVRSNILTPQTVADGFTKIGPVATNLWLFNALSVYDTDTKTDYLYMTSFNSAGLGQLIRLDYVHGVAKAWTMPAGIGSWGILQGKDGRIYLGSYYGGELLCFDPKSEKWIPLPQAPEEFRKEEMIVCDLGQAPNGDIYYGTYPGAHLVRYDPRAGTVSDLGKAADENYLRQVTPTPWGTVLAGVGTKHSRIIAYDIQTAKFREIEPEQYRTSGVMPRPFIAGNFVVQPVADKVLLYDGPSLKFLRAYPLHDASGFTLLDASHLLFQEGTQMISLNVQTGERSLYAEAPNNISNGRWYLAHNGNLVGLRVQSYTYLNVAREQAITHRIPIDGLGQEVFWLRSMPDGKIFGGPGLGQTMFSYDPETRKLVSYDQVIDQSGEIYYGVPFKNKLYTISYVEATLAVFDPALPWNQGGKPASNPRTILRIPDAQHRPVGGIHTGPDNKLYIGTQPNYGLLGGALSVFDPGTEKLEVYRNIVPDQEINAIATDDRYVYCAADPDGGGGSRAKTSKSHFFVWDPESKKIIFDQAFANANIVGAIATVHGHAYFVEDGALMDYNRADNTLTPIDSFTNTSTGGTFTLDKKWEVPLESMQAAQDGTLWSIVGGRLIHFAPAMRTVELFPVTVGHASLGLTIGKDGTIFFGSNTDVWSYRPIRPIPPNNFGQ